VILRLNLAGFKGPAMRPLPSEKCLQGFVLHRNTCALVLFVQARGWNAWKRSSHTLHAGPLVVHQYCQAQIADLSANREMALLAVPSALD
jgi:hypothetical protein